MAGIEQGFVNLKNLVQNMVDGAKEMGKAIEVILGSSKVKRSSDSSGSSGRGCDVDGVVVDGIVAGIAGLGGLLGIGGLTAVRLGAGAHGAAVSFGTPGTLT